MRAIVGVLLLCFAGACHGRRVIAAMPEIPNAPAAQSFAQISQKEPKLPDWSAMAMFLLALDPASAFKMRQGVPVNTFQHTPANTGALTQQTPPMTQLSFDQEVVPLPPVEGSAFRTWPSRAAEPMMQLSVDQEVAPGTNYRGRGLPTRAGPGGNSFQLLQGGSLKTWTYRSPAVEQVQVVLSTEGRPLDADIELWHGPDNTPVKARVYVENGEIRPFSAVIETPRGPNTVAIRNIGQLEFPIAANVVADDVDQPSGECLSSSMTIQGGALRTYPFDPSVDSVQVLLRTDGRPLNARIELLQGPNNNKQVIELYTEDGLDRPFFCFLATPGAGNVVRVVNTAPVEFPMTASVVPHSINEDMSRGGDAIIGGDISW